MKTYISKEDASDLAWQQMKKSRIGDKPVYCMTANDIANVINLAIAKVIGEPVDYLINEMYEKDGTLFAKTAIPLYAIKELPND